MVTSTKCKNCGYIFDELDGSLCPECFTSRAEASKKNSRPVSSNTYTPQNAPISKPNYLQNVCQHMSTYTPFTNLNKSAINNKSAIKFVLLVIGIFTLISSIIPIIFILKINHSDNETKEHIYTTFQGYQDEFNDNYLSKEFNFGDVILNNGLEITVNSIEDLGEKFDGIEYKDDYHFISANISIKNKTEAPVPLEIYPCFLDENNNLYDYIISSDLTTFNYKKDFEVAVGESFETNAIFSIPTKLNEATLHIYADNTWYNDAPNEYIMLVKFN